MTKKWEDQDPCSFKDSIQNVLRSIQWMNEAFELETNTQTTDLGRQRLEQFMRVLKDEIDELNDVYDVTHLINGKPKFDAVHLADTFGDLLVYLLSECCRWGIPIVPVFEAIMFSQESKLVDGKPLKAPDGSKFIKGPNYSPPEPDIKRILEDWNGRTEPTNI